MTWYRRRFGYPKVPSRSCVKVGRRADRSVLYCTASLGPSLETHWGFAMASVFVSHRGSDSDQAVRLASALRDAGHQVWLDTWEVMLGDSIIGKMNEGLELATHVVVCFSGAGLAPWMDTEWMSTLAGQLGGYGVRLLPVLLTGGELPALLRHIKYADLAADWPGGIAELQRALVR